MRERRTLSQVQFRFERLSSNLQMIRDKEGNARVQMEIKTLKEYLDNPNMDLKGKMEKSFGERKQTLRWIMGDVV